MTEEEAIKRLDEQAFKALKQEPCGKDINVPATDCISRQAKTEVLNKIRAEITDTLYVDSLIFGELIDFRNGKISADDVIEEFNRVTKMEVLQIIDKYKAESEDKE